MNIKMNLYRFLAVTLVVLAVGCEWESSGDDHSWTEELNWADFSGVYRNSSGDLVSGKGFSSTETDSTPDGLDGPILVVSGEVGGSYPAGETTLSGRLNEYPQIVDGSVTLVFSDGTTTLGSFVDSGGVLSGYYTLDSEVEPNQLGTGTIEYDTGRWTLNIQRGGFFSGVDLTIDYTWIDTGAIVDDTDVEVEDDNNISISSMHVTQVGNQLTFTDSEGGAYTGVMWKGSTPGGDDTGSTSGEVTTGFQVSSDNVTITGTFSGNYTAASSEDDSSGFGSLTGKTIDGTWVQDGSALDMHGTSGN